MTESRSAHWDTIFETTPDPRLGWYEDEAATTLKMLDAVPDLGDRTAFVPGVGTSVLVEALRHRGLQLILNDISEEALDRLRSRLNEPKTGITWMVGDITDPIPDDVPAADLWIDRAVLHFLTEDDDIDAYFDRVRSVIQPGGYVLLAEFSTSGATRCAGLPVRRYSLEEMADGLGEDFETVESRNYTYTNPNGDPRPYLYALFRRTA